jgi:hypothetical protein
MVFCSGDNSFRRSTYSDVYLWARTLAASLQHAGLRKDDRRDPDVEPLYEPGGILRIPRFGGVVLCSHAEL